MDTYEEMVKRLSALSMSDQVYSREARNLMEDITHNTNILFIGEVYGDTLSHVFTIEANYKVELYKLRHYIDHRYVHFPYASKDILYHVISNYYSRNSHRFINIYKHIQHLRQLEKEAEKELAYIRNQIIHYEKLVE